MNNTAPNFKIGINVSNDAMQSDERICELYFLDAIYNKQNVNWLTGEVTEESMLADVIEQVNACNPTKIISYIDSWGGSCDVGMGIYNYLRSHSAKVETIILNSCASIATVISAAGNKGKITMPADGFMVIHKAMTTASGNADELREAADLAERYTNNILSIYEKTNRKGKTKAELASLMEDGDYWMTGTEAKEMGFVDDCYNDEKVTITNSIAHAKQFYNNIPARILNMAKEPVVNIAESSNVFNAAIMKVTEIIDGFKAWFTTNNKPVPTVNITGSETPVNLTDALAEPITNMLNAVNAGVKADIEAAALAATEAVTAANKAVKDEWKVVIDGLTEKVGVIEAKLKTQEDTIAAQAVTINEQKNTIANLTADVEKHTGRPTNAARAEDTDTGAAKKTPTFANRTTRVAIGG